MHRSCLNFKCFIKYINKLESEKRTDKTTTDCFGNFIKKITDIHSRTTRRTAFTAVYKGTKQIYIGGNIER